VLKQAELGMPVADIIRQIGISEQTFYRWKKLYAGAGHCIVQRCRSLKHFNSITSRQGV